MRVRRIVRTGCVFSDRVRNSSKIKRQKSISLQNTCKTIVTIRMNFSGLPEWLEVWEMFVHVYLFCGLSLSQRVCVGMSSQVMMRVREDRLTDWHVCCAEWMLRGVLEWPFVALCADTPPRLQRFIAESRNGDSNATQPHLKTPCSLKEFFQIFFTFWCRRQFHRPLLAPHGQALHHTMR